MQDIVSNRRPAPKGTTQVQTMVITAITLFALSGLMVGFAFGAFVRPKQLQTVAPTQPTAPITPVAHSSTPTIPPVTPTPAITQLGCPTVKVDNAQNTQMADGVTPYKAFVQAKDKTNVPQGKVCADPEQAKNVTVDGIICRLWLIKATDDPTTGFEDILKNKQSKDNLFENLKAPFPKEIQGGLIFSDTTTQVQNCNKGLGSWQYQVAPSVDPGQYYLMGLTEYQDTLYYNWSWTTLTVTAKAKQ